MTITTDIKQSYDELGYVSLGVLFSPAEVEQLRADLWEFAKTNPPSTYGLLFNNLWRHLPSFARVVHSPVVTQCVCELIGVPEVVLFQDNLVWKFPGSEQIQWHQDFSYQPLTSPAGVTLWMCLDDATPDSGCLHYIRGTHKLGERQPADFIEGATQPRIDGLPDMDWRERAADIAFVGAKPGEVLAHSPLVWHMTPPNTTQRQRRAFTMNWITPDVRWDPAHAPHPFNHYLDPVFGELVEGELFPHLRRSE